MGRAFVVRQSSMIKTANAITSQVSTRRSAPTSLAIIKNAVSMPLLSKNSFCLPVTRR